MKLLIAAAFVTIALAMPADVAKKPNQLNDNCGAVTLNKKWKLAVSNDNTAGCEICLDLVEIEETYAECGEAMVEHKMENDCDVKYKNKPMEDALCRALVDSIAHEVIDDTEQDPTAVCTKFLHKTCKFEAI